MSNALAIVPPAPSASLALEPTDLESAYKVAQHAAASRLLGATARTPEAALVVIMTGRELGLTAMQSLRSLHIIEGKPTMSADLMVALVRRSPLCRSWQLVESSNTIATYETQRVGDAKPTRLSFTIDDAKTAGLMSRNTWKSHPAAMLRARAASSLCRAVYPDVMLGVYETDELGPTEQRVPDVKRDAEAMETIAEATSVSVAEYRAGVEAFIAETIAKIENATSLAELDAIAVEAKRESSERGVTKEDRQRLSAEFAARRVILAAPVAAEVA